MSRSSRIGSILEWFRTGASTDEIRMVMPLVLEAVQKRTAAPTVPVKAVKAAKQRTGAERSAAAKRAWEKRRLNAANTTETAGEEVTQ